MFQIGERVFVEGVIEGTTSSNGELHTCKVRTPDAVISVGVKRLIPAHRVTVAPARRAAEFPKDWGKEVKTEYGTAKLVGCYDDNSHSYIVSKNGTFVCAQTAEVEE